ncbi:taurine ABC transporter substrate-binding protein [Paenibacillus xanthanilyticus]|uniref:ABC transporter substrate-binding protein n=1 Tax=Paenibacillus xanthanilyticus TaxID=1783531 RepID=A0ABV8K1V2_9BACL
MSRFNRKLNVRALALPLLASALLLAGCGSNGGNSNPAGETKETIASADVQSEAKQPEEVRIGFQVIPNAELLAKATGAVEKKFPNTKITWIPFESGRDVNTAIAAKGIDLGLAGSVPVAVAVANKLDLQVYFLHDIIGEAESLAVRGDSGIASLKDAVGRTIAVPFGSTSHFSLLSGLQAAGVAEKDVTILDMQPPDILAAWQRGDIDGAFVWNPVLGKIKADGGKVVVTAKELAEQGIVTSDVGIVRKTFADEYPEFLKQYVAVLDETIQFYRDKPEEAAKALAPLLGQNEQDSLDQMNQLVWLKSEEQREPKYLGASGAESDFAKTLKATGDFLAAQKTITTAPDLAFYQQAIRTDAIGGQ